MPTIVCLTPYFPKKSREKDLWGGISLFGFHTAKTNHKCDFIENKLSIQQEKELHS